MNVYEKYAETHKYSSLAGEYATIDYADGGEPYAWDEIRVLRGRDGRLYVGADSGCSCNGFGDDIDLADLVLVASWQEAADQVKAWISESPEYRDREVPGMNLIERLTNTQPAAHLTNLDPAVFGDHS